MGKISSRVNDLERRMAKSEQEVIKYRQESREIKEQLDVLTDAKIIDMLQETNSPYSDKPRYSYKEISAATNRSSGYISNLAQEKGLGRRSIRSID